MNCAEWSLLSLGLSVVDVGVRRVGGSVRSGASPMCSLAKISELSVGELWEAAVGARLSRICAVEGVEKVRDKTRRFSLGYLCYDLERQRTA